MGKFRVAVARDSYFHTLCCCRHCHHTELQAVWSHSVAEVIFRGSAVVVSREEVVSEGIPFSHILLLWLPQAIQQQQWYLGCLAAVTLFSCSEVVAVGMASEWS